MDLLYSVWSLLTLAENYELLTVSSNRRIVCAQI